MLCWGFGAVADHGQTYTAHRRLLAANRVENKPLQPPALRAHPVVVRADVVLRLLLRAFELALLLLDDAETRN